MRRMIAVCLGLWLVLTATASAEKRPTTLADMFAFQRVADPQISPDGKLVAYQVGVVDLAGNKTTTNLWVAATDGKTPPRRLTSSTKRDAHPRWSPDGSKILFESNRTGDNTQLWVIDLAGGEARQLTTLSTGASNGIWSPDGKLVAFSSAVYPEFSKKPFAEADKLNKQKIEETEKGPVKAKVFTRLFYRHWDEYVEDKRQHLFVISAAGSEPKDVTPGERDAYPTSTTFSVGDDFTFSPDSSHLVFTAVPDRNEAWSTNYDICRVPVVGDKIENVTKDNLAADGSPRFSPDGKKLAWRAQKTAGYEADKWDILVADCMGDGSLTSDPRNVTKTKDVSVNEFVWLKDSKTILFATDDAAGTTIWETHTDEFGFQAIFKGAQITAMSVDRDASRLAFQVAAMHHPPVVIVTGTAPGSENLIQRFDPNKELLAQLDLRRPEPVKVSVEGGVTMQMWILKPPGFDPAKKWPVAFLVHGGPQGAWEDGWSYRWNPTLWAAQGYVVVLPNPRGSTGFGQKFVDEISGDWGGKCYRDLVAGLDYVEKLPYVDKDRIASAGASFGGYMMDWFAVNEIASRFKCLISHCSVWNFESMWGTTDELWFDEWEHQGLPWDKPEEYAKFSPHKKAGNLGKYKTPMLVIQNDLDFRCPIGQGHELFSALQRQHVPSRFINFPDEGHWVLKPKNSEYWHKEVFAWLKKYCPPGAK
ncbi:MAG TPA: S9 family peptidase [Gemmataceae bacterium]|nr:S9 family peptidase [Gemmataceae bacterium]